MALKEAPNIFYKQEKSRGRPEKGQRGRPKKVIKQLKLVQKLAKYGEETGKKSIVRQLKQIQQNHIVSLIEHPKCLEMTNCKETPNP